MLFVWGDISSTMFSQSHVPDTPQSSFDSVVHIRIGERLFCERRYGKYQVGTGDILWCARRLTGRTFDASIDRIF
jgi:hypothetical protein